LIITPLLMILFYIIDLCWNWDEHMREAREQVLREYLANQIRANEDFELPRS
jgi:hypothetical protein